MKPYLFILLNLTGLIPAAVTLLGIVPHKYDLIMSPMSWPDAQNYCRANFMDLATILNDTDELRFNKEVESKALTSPAWVGLYNDINGWRWSLNDFWLNNFTDWAPGRPKTGGEYACVLYGQYYKWWDIPCDGKRRFICYDATFSAADKFIGFSNYLTWTEAQTYCRTHHTDLASSFNSSDETLLAQVHSSQGDSWIGLYRDTWKWSDGTNVSDLTWSPGQPDNLLLNENCAVISNGQLSDEPCGDSNYFFCHTLSPKRGQIMRTEVQSDASVLDPAVQSSMLQKIQLKLKEKGVFNVTVSWRMQPDGNIFHKKKEQDEM